MSPEKKIEVLFDFSFRKVNWEYKSLEQNYFSILTYHKGPIGADGNACPVTCPVVCGVGEMSCPGGVDSNNCMMPATCIPMNGDIFEIW